MNDMTAEKNLGTITSNLIEAAESMTNEELQQRKQKYSGRRNLLENACFYACKYELEERI